MSLICEITNVPNVIQTTLIPEDDHSGWTSLEQAAYRGYVDIARYLEAQNARNPASVSGNPFSVAEVAPLMPQSREHLISSHILGNPALHPPIKMTQLLVSLGSFDTKHAVASVDLGPYLRMNDLYSQDGLSIEITVDGANGPGQVMPLPIPEDVANNLWVFSITDPSEIKIAFNILRQPSDAHGERQTTLVGRGIASLNDIKRRLGVNHESLTRDCTISILEKDTLNSMGTVTYTFLVVKPFPHEQSTSIKTDDLWNENEHTKVVGHRGTLLNYAPDAISMY